MAGVRIVNLHTPGVNFPGRVKVIVITQIWALTPPLSWSPGKEKSEGEPEK